MPRQPSEPRLDPETVLREANGPALSPASKGRIEDAVHAAHSGTVQACLPNNNHAAGPPRSAVPHAGRSVPASHHSRRRRLLPSVIGVAGAVSLAACIALVGWGLAGLVTGNAPAEPAGQRHSRSNADPAVSLPLPRLFSVNQPRDLRGWTVEVRVAQETDAQQGVWK